MEVFLYEYNLDLKNNYGFDITLGVFAICLLVAFIKNRGRNWSIVLLLFSLLLFLIQLISIPVFLGKYKDIAKRYQEGDYLIVEGYVENYHAEPRKGHSPEMFEVAGIKFQTSDYIYKLGYNRTNNSHGVITGENNQYLKIYYIEDLTYEKDDFHRYIILAIIE